MRVRSQWEQSRIVCWQFCCCSYLPPLTSISKAVSWWTTSATSITDVHKHHLLCKVTKGEESHNRCLALALRASSRTYRTWNSLSHPTVCCLDPSISTSTTAFLLLTTAFLLLGPVSLFDLSFLCLSLGFSADEGFYSKYFLSFFSFPMRASNSSPFLVLFTVLSPAVTFFASVLSVSLADQICISGRIPTRSEQLHTECAMYCCCSTRLSC